MEDKIFMYDEESAKAHRLKAFTHMEAGLRFLGIVSGMILWIILAIVIAICLSSYVLIFFATAINPLLTMIVPSVLFALWLAVRSETQRTAYIVKDSSLYMVKLIGTKAEVLTTQGVAQRYIYLLNRALEGSGIWKKQWYQWIFNGEAEVRRLDEIKVLKSCDKYMIVQYRGFQGKMKKWKIYNVFPGLQDELMVNEGMYARHSTYFPDVDRYEKDYKLSLAIILCIIVWAVVVAIPMLGDMHNAMSIVGMDAMEQVPEALLEEIFYDNYEYFDYDRSTVKFDNATGEIVYYIFGTFELDNTYYAILITEKADDVEGFTVYSQSETCEGWAYYVRAVKSISEE